MGNSPSQDFCPNLAAAAYNSDLDLLFTIPYISILIALVLLPFLLTLPCLSLKYILAYGTESTLSRYISMLQVHIMAFVSLFDFGMSKRDRVMIAFHENGDVNLIKKKPHKDVPQFQNAAEVRYYDFTTEMRALGGYISVFLGFIIFGVVVYMYSVHEQFITENVIVQASGIGSRIVKRHLLVTLEGLPCKGAADLRVDAAVGNDIATQPFEQIAFEKSEHDNLCNLAFNLDVFGRDDIASTYGAAFRVQNWAPITDIKDSRHVNVRIEAPLYRVSATEFEFPQGESAFIFMDSCRQARFPVTKTRSTIGSTMTIRTRCDKIFGTALKCFEENLSFGHFHVATSDKADDKPLVEIVLHLGTMQLNSFIAKTSDTQLFVIIVMGLLSLIVLQPVFKRIVVHFFVYIIRRRITGKSPGKAKSISLGLGACCIMGGLSFLLFMFVTDVYLEFKKHTPEFLFDANLWIFGRTAEIMLIDLLFASVLVLLNVLAYMGIMTFILAYLVYDGKGLPSYLVGDLFTDAEKLQILGFNYGAGDKRNDRKRKRKPVTTLEQGDNDGSIYQSANGDDEIEDNTDLTAV